MTAKKWKKYEIVFLRKYKGFVICYRDGIGGIEPIRTNPLWAWVELVTMMRRLLLTLRGGQGFEKRYQFGKAGEH